MHTDLVAFEIMPEVQGLPCLYTPSQGKPCTPASLLIAPGAGACVSVRYQSQRTVTPSGEVHAHIRPVGH